MNSKKQTAFMSAYQACHEPFVRYCSALAYGKVEAEDLVQDVLLSAFHNFEKIEKKEELLHYLIRAARNRSISLWRKQSRSIALCEKQAERLCARGATAEVVVDAHIVYEALDQLPVAMREAIVLFEVSGLSMAEIAKIQGCSEGALKTKVSRGRAKVKALLEGRAKPVRSSLAGALKSIAL